MAEMSHHLEYALVASWWARRAVTAFALMAGVGVPLGAQHADMPTSSMMHFMAEVTPVLTRATPTAGRRNLTEAYLSQPVVMFGVERGPLRLAGTLNIEGLTMARGELTTGAQGEGYVDRRHPHTYLHELMAGVERPVGVMAASFYAGRGFVPFGSDDPMVRPFQKFPVNHHLAQVLERLVAVAAVRRGALSLEGAMFGGDEPTGPGRAPEYRRFGDSWAARITWRPLGPLELSASTANVVSPEIAVGGGLDQSKRSTVARWIRASADRELYALGEWARTAARTPAGALSGVYDTWLVESVICRNGPRLAVRVERTDRPEEERLTDLFRTPNPPTDNATLGVTRWTTATVALSTTLRTGPFRARPFIEVARARASQQIAGSVFNPGAFYGSDRVWMLSAGARLSVGHGHERMGRYGAALPATSMAQSPNGGHDMMDHADMPVTATPLPVNRCAN